MLEQLNDWYYWVAQIFTDLWESDVPIIVIGWAGEC